MQENAGSVTVGSRALPPPLPMSQLNQGCSDAAAENAPEPVIVPAVLRRGLGALALFLLLAPPVSPETSERDAAFTPYAGADWPTADARDYGYDPDRLSDAIERIGADEGVYSVLLVRGGELIAEQYFREGTRTKIHNLKSASKSIVSALVGMVIADGSLALDDSVVDVLDVRGVEPDRRSITVRNVLMMASGLESTSYEAYNAWIAGSDWVRGALRQERLDSPGVQYRYSTGNTHLLSALVGRASGRSTRSFAEARLFGPIGIEIGGWETDPQGIHIGGNNLALTPRDMAKFGELYLRGGRWGDQRVVPAEWVRESTRIQIAADHEVYGDYGYQWFVSRRIPGDFIAVGFGGQYIYVSPAYDAVVVITSTLESKGRAWEQRIFDIIERDLLRADGMRTTSNRDRDDAAYGPAGETRTEAVTPDATASAPTRGRTDVDVRAALQTDLESARARAASLEERLGSMESQREQEATVARQRLERSESDREQLQIELERSRRALEESGKERARLAQLVEEADRREALVANESTEERQRAAARASSLDTEVARLRRLVADTNDQVAALQSQAQIRDVELQRARDELTRLERRVEAGDATVRDRDAVLDEQLARFEDERKDLETQLAEERSRADQTLREVQRMRQTESSLRSDLDLRSRELSTARERAEAAEQALKVRDARLASLQTDLETLRAQGRADASERQALTETVKELQARIDTVASELDDSEEVARTRAEEVSDLRTAQRVETTRREQAETQIAALGARLEDERARTASLEADLEDARARLASQERSGSESAEAAADLARARGDELIEMRAAHRTEMSRREQAEQQVSALRRELGERQARVASLESEMDELQTRLGAQQRDNADQATLATDLRRAEARVASLRSERDDLQKQSADRRREAEQLAQRLDESQDASRAQATQLTNLRADLSSAVERATFLEAEVQDLRDTLQSVSDRRESDAGREAAALDQAQSRVADLGRRLTVAEADADQARSRLTELNEALARAQTRSLDQETELDQLRDELRAATARAEDVEGRLAEVRRTSEARRVALEKADAAARSTGEDSRYDELLAQLASREQSLLALRQELEATKGLAAARKDSQANGDVARVQQNYEALVAESEMLARRAGEQGRRIAELEQRLAATRTPEDLDGELRAVRSEVERLLSDRRLSEVLRADLVRLRRVLVTLQSARERTP